jgi:hypothetical protein
MAPVAPAADWM